MLMASREVSPSEQRLYSAPHSQAEEVAWQGGSEKKDGIQPHPVVREDLTGMLSDFCLTVAFLRRRFRCKHSLGSGGLSGIWSAFENGEQFLKGDKRVSHRSPESR